MKRLRRLQTFAAAFLAAQVVIGYLGWLTPQHEVYPLATWFLFSLVPNRLTDYDLSLRGLAAQPLEPPRSFNHASTLVSGIHSVASYQLIQQLGEAVEGKDLARAGNVRRQLEEQFYKPGVRYDLVKVTFRPVERWKTGRVLSSRVIQSFVSGEAHPSAPPRPTPET